MTLTQLREALLQEFKGKSVSWDSNRELQTKIEALTNLHAYSVVDNQKIEVYLRNKQWDTGTVLNIKIKKSVDKDRTTYRTTYYTYKDFEVLANGDSDVIEELVAKHKEGLIALDKARAQEVQDARELLQNKGITAEELVSIVKQIKKLTYAQKRELGIGHL